MKKQTHIKTFSAGIIFLLASLSACSQTTDKTEVKAGKVMEGDMKSDEYWKKTLTAEQYHILREKGTERAFTGALLDNKAKGTYVCAACKKPLFQSTAKFDSGTGWPSFDAEIGSNVKETEDQSHGMVRSEIICANCDGHLGHVFDDGPTKTGLRYCVNSLSLNFVAEKKMTAVSADRQEKKAESDTIVLGGGCYWCVEAVYELLEGVNAVESGYSGGAVKNPSYEAVCSGKTGHAEVVQLIYNPQVTSFTEILKVFFTVHDPTTLNRQGADVGTQYRSVIFYRNAEQEKTAKKLISELNLEKVYDAPIVTEVSPLKNYYKAEAYHQNYYFENKQQGYCQAVIQPKIEKFEKVFKNKLKNK